MTLVSVVMPVFNGAPYIAEAIGSVLNQSHGELELIVVDDGSTDGTASICASQSDSRLVYHRLSHNCGTATAVNAGYDRAQGPYIAHMDADDVAMPRRIEQQLAYLDRHKSIDVVGSTIEFIGAASGCGHPPPDDGRIKVNLLAGVDSIHNPTAMIRRSFFVKAGMRCDPTLRGVFDWGFWVDAMMRGASFANLPEPLLRYRVHDAQQSRDQRHLRAEQHRVRDRVLQLFFPALSAAERDRVEPLLQWAAPPPLIAAAVRDGLVVLDRLERFKRQSEAGEDREVLAAFLATCRKRWETGLAALTASRA